MVKAKAIIDLGSNSIKCLVYESPTGKILSQSSRIGRLAEGRSPDGSIGGDSWERNRSLLLAAVEEARSWRTETIQIYATEALRKAPNARFLIEQFQRDTGISINILSAQEEAELSFAAVSAYLPDRQGVVFDIGGGSLELSRGSRERVLTTQSLPLGALAMGQRFISGYPCSTEELQALEQHCLAGLQGRIGDQEPKLVIGVGGTVCSLAALLNPSLEQAALEGATLSLSDLEQQVVRLSKLSLEQIRNLPGLQYGRERSILAGAVICTVLMRLLGSQELLVSTRGWRYALLV